MISRDVFGRSEMANHVRQKDWSATPLGAIDTWSETLRSTVNMLLEIPTPMQLFWGPEMITIYNDGVLPFLGEKHPEALGMPAYDVWRESWSTVGPTIEAVFERGESYGYEDSLVPILLHGAIEERYWTYSFSPVYGADGMIAGLLNITQNTTQAVLAERALRASEKRFRQLVDKASIGIAIGARTGELSYLNPSLLNLLEYTAEEVAAGEVRWDMLTPERFADLDAIAIEQLNTTGVAEPYEKAYYTKSGESVPLLIGAAVIPTDIKYGIESDIAVFATDLRKQKRAEEALVQSEKLAAVGKLASSISHEINNPLASVTNLLYLARRDPLLPKGCKDYLEAADRELSRVSQITSNTLRFHRQSTAPTSIQVDLLIDESLHFYTARLANHDIELRKRYTPDLCITGYEGNIRQVVNNLIGNAVDAMLEGQCCLMIRTRALKHPVRGEPGVLITIADTGEGIESSVQRCIFDAFYTTKGNQGTGLGLWISSRIVKMHSGYLKVRSSTERMHHGTVFQLWLPVELPESAREAWDPGFGM